MPKQKDVSDIYKLLVHVNLDLYRLSELLKMTVY